MGLKTEIYWLVNYVLYFSLYMVAVLVMWLLAAVLGFNYWTVNDGGPLFMLLFLWGHTMTASAFFASTLFGKAKTATVVGYTYVFGAGLLAAQLIRVYLDSVDTPEGIIFLISMVPPFALFRGLLDLRYAVNFGGPGMSWALMNEPDVQLDDVFIFLFVEWIVLLLAAVYMEMVFPSGVGVQHHPLFFLQKSFWFPSVELEAVRREVTTKEPKDVALEREAAWDETQPRMIKMLDLRKVYPASRGNPPKVAVDNMAMTVRKGECFGLLGPNGSGKSTTCNMLCGYFSPTAGTATMNGFDIRRDIDLIHLQMGVCPQDNIIWETLTGLEHMMFYGRLKDLSGAALEKEAKRRLQQVDLYGVRNKAAGKYSGGMKRRLCVAMALIGSPRMVLLDEPTTGLDPKARTNLWQVIRGAKSHSAVLLTTHSMEESEALCERVGIFVSGTMRTLGTPANLKYSFGEFYKLTVTVKPEGQERLEELVSELCPTATIFNKPVRGTVSYKLPREDIQLSAVFDAVRGWDGVDILDWGVSSVSLEEVFLQITLEKKTGKTPDNSGSDSAVDVSSDDGRAIKSSDDSTEDETTSPATGTTTSVEVSTSMA